MGDYANTILLAWPYPGEQMLPDALRDLLDTECGLPDLDEPVATLDDDEVVVLAGDSESGRIIAISDTQANDGTARYSEVIAALTDAGMSVYAANHSGYNYAAWNVYHLVASDGAVAEQHRGFADGEIVVSASDITDPGEYLSQLSDSDLAARVRVLLDHPPLPRAVRALTWAAGPRTPAAAGATGDDAG